jgi:hypothetical protein
MFKQLSTYLALMICAGITSCSLIHDDLPDCYDSSVRDEETAGLDISFVYDYNTQRADMFGAHVGAVRVYIYDENGSFVTSNEECKDRGDALDAPGYAMHIDLPEGRYKIVAVGQQASPDRISLRHCAKFVLPQLDAPGSIDDFRIRLDRDANGYVPNGGEHLDTLWIGNIDTLVSVVANTRTEARVSLIRNTKRILLGLHNIDAPEDINLEDYSVKIIADNGLTLYNNEHPIDGELTYTPHAMWVSDWNDSDTPARAVHYELSTGRLIRYDKPDEMWHSARLVITNNTNGTLIADLNLPEILQQGRGAYETENYSAQEYLDREYSYNLDLFLRGDKWVYINMTVEAMAWTKRQQNASL